MLFARRFTKIDVSPYAGLNWVVRKSGPTAGCRDATVPEVWSQTAVDILVGKYFRKAGVPTSRNRARVGIDIELSVPEWLLPCVPGAGATFGGETDARQVFDRLAGFWTYWGWKLGYFQPGAGGTGLTTSGDYRKAATDSNTHKMAVTSASAFYDEIRWMLARQVAAPASPQWFNAGLNWAYGIGGDDCGQWAVQWLKFSNDTGDATPKTSKQGFGVEPSANPYTRPALSACFIQSIKDNLVEKGGIQDLMRREALVFKYGGGSGTNWSPVRGAGEKLSGGGVSSGLLSFLQAPDKSAGAIKSGGTTRRAARMLCLNDDHPELMEFTTWKADEEKKVAAMAAGAELVRREVRLVYDAARAYTDAPNDDTSPRTKAAAKLLTRRYKQALGAGVPKAIIDAARIAGRAGERCPDVPLLPPDFEGAAYSTVGGQNANNSIRVTNKFLFAAESGKDWHLYGRLEKAAADKGNRDPVPFKTVLASDALKAQAYAAWECGCPGWQYDDTINEWWTCPADGRVTASNPCCLVGETLVDTSEGLIPIQSLVSAFDSGQSLPHVFARDTDSGRPVLRKITRAWKAGETRDMIRVTTDKGIEIIATPEHRFLTYSGGWVRADRLSVGSSLRKVARHTNTERSDRVSISDSGAGTQNGTEYQNRWMWKQVNGPIADGFDVHHKNEDATDDRLSNFELIATTDHKSLHASGAANCRFIDATDADLLAVWELLAKKPDQLTPGRWNACVRKLGLSGKVPVAFTGENPRIRGVLWPEFVGQMTSLREAANDRVSKIERLTYSRPMPVYDIEVEGVHNFAVTSDPRRGRHTIIVHNSEYMAADDTACNLASLNLMMFFAGPMFDHGSYEHAARIFTVILDITVTAAGYPSEEIARGSWNYRTLGLGYTNIGAVLMRMGIAYDSDPGRAWAGYLTALMHYVAGTTSAELAAELGTFPRFAANKPDVMRVMHNHATYGRVGAKLRDYQHLTWKPEPLCNRPGSDAVPAVLRDRVNEMANTMFNAVAHCGMRNAQLTLLAPNGTIGLLMDCDTTGVEPDFALVKWKKLAGGGFFKIVNQSIPAALNELGYTKEQTADVVRWVVGEGKLSDEDRGVFVAAGIPPEVLDKVSAAVPGVMNLADAFAPHMARALADFKIAPERIRDASYRACGHATVEGAPHLKPEHVAVFDCANQCGADGTRSLSVGAHLEMMAAVQPVLSGAISKTVNFPADSTPEAFRRAAVRSWKLGLKAMAGYRDGSKMAQPLNATGDAADVDQGDAEPDLSDVPVAAAVPNRFPPVPVVDPVKQQGQRRKMPNRVYGPRVKFNIIGPAGKSKFYLRCGNYPEGKLGEIFIDCAKEGATLRGIMNAFAMAVSIGLQRGVPLEEFVEAFTFTKFEPNGPIQGHDRLKRCDSVIDAVFRELAITYLNRDELAHVQPEQTVAATIPKAAAEHVTVDATWKAADGTVPLATKQINEIVRERREARSKGYTGNRCPKCKSFALVRAGACERCGNCGEQSGCV